MSILQNEQVQAALIALIVVAQIVQRGVVQFADSFRLNEGKDPTGTQIAAVNFELEDVANRAVAGGK